MKLLRFGLMAFVWLLGWNTLTAQTSKVVERGQVLTLSTESGAKSYQWQVSSDGKNYVNLPNGTTSKFNVKINAPSFYRVQKTADNGTVTEENVLQVSLSEVAYSDKVSITSGGHGYVEDKKGNTFSGIKIPEDRDKNLALATKSLSEWTNPDACAVCYIHHPAEVIDTKMDLQVQSGKKVDFRLEVFDPNHLEEALATTYTTVTGTGNTQEVFLVGMKYPREDYYRYRLTCLNGCENIIAIQKLKHYSPSAEKSYKPAYLSSPSVHLKDWCSTNDNAPKGNLYDWCYQEVMMPEESDITGTYIMSLGVLSGYMGIQMNGYMPDGRSRHDIIFSMWDDGSTDDNPDLPDNLRSDLVDKNPLATSERFQNEGTGVKSFMAGHHWECGKFVQFLTNCRIEKATYTAMENGKKVTKQQENTLVSAWFNAQDGKGWQYIATLRLANKNKRFDKWYSFLENYNFSSGQLLRKGYYRNGYACTEIDGNRKWFHFNQVDFGHTDGGSEEGKRNDYGQGVVDNYLGENGEGTFFMTTGGFVATNVTGKTVQLNKKDIAVDSINLDVLLDRVDEAIAHEKYSKNQKDNLDNSKMDKSTWTVECSSEETSGEGENGRAALIIDGDKKTYWHSQWKGATPDYPHELVIDMQEEKLINGIDITMSDGPRRYMKAFNLYVSSDEAVSPSTKSITPREWTKVYSTDDAPNDESFRVVLDNPAKGRFLRLEITQSRGEDGKHVRVNEIDVLGTAVSSQLNKKGWSVVGFSSEETSGEGTNGRAAQTIDGSKDTYWHSKWTGGGSSCPHFIAVDMNDYYVIDGMQITMSGGNRRYIQNFNLYASNDNKKWVKVYSDNDAPNQEAFKFDLPNPISAKYFKIEVLRSRDEKGVHTRINEIEVFGRLLTPAEKMLDEAKVLLTDPKAHQVGYPSDAHYNELSSAYEAMLLKQNGIDEGTQLLKALNSYKTTDDINLPQNNIIYTLTSNGRGSLIVDVTKDRIQSTKNEEIKVSANYKDSQQQFTFVNKDGKFYLYNSSLKKYMTSNADVLSDEPKDAIRLVKHGKCAGRVFMKFDNSHNVNINGNGSVVIDTWGIPDDGNAFEIEEVGLLSDLKSTAGALSEKSIATFSSPYAVVAEEGANVYYATEDVQQSAILLKLVPAGQAIPANSGVLVASDDLTKVRLVKSDENDVVADLTDNVLLSSAFNPVLMQFGDYILMKPQNKGMAFYKARPGSQLARYRSYLHLSTNAPSIRMIVVKDEVTGIDENLNDNIKNAPIYDLSGRQVNRVVKGGVYIQNGKKFFIK